VEEVAFVDVVTWGRTAEVCAEFLKKGRPTYVEGRLTQSRWESPEGKKMSRLRVTAENVQFLGGRPKGGDGVADAPFEPKELSLDDDAPASEN
jgi:single-strand DNA-binding protein